MASIKCVKCGFVSWASAETCKKCGAQLSESINADGTAIPFVDRVKQNARRVKLVCSLFAVIVVIGVASCLFAFKPTDPDRTEVFVLKDGTRKSSKAWFHSWFASDPTVDEIVAQYLKVTGWEANPSALTSFVAKGRFQIRNVPGETLVQAQMPYRVSVHYHWSTVEGDMDVQAEGSDKLLITQKYYTKVLQRGANGKKGWSLKGWANKDAQVDPKIKLESTKMVDVKGEALIDLKRGAEFLNFFLLPKKYPRLYLSGKTMVGDRITYEVSNREVNDPMAVMYFDVETGMLLKFWSYRRESPYIPSFDEFIVPTRDSFDQAEVDLEDYREVNGVKLPFLIRQHFREFWITAAITDLKPNVTIEPSVFQKPADSENKE